MAKISVKRFVELLQKSGLIPDTVLRDSLTRLKQENGGAPLSDTKFVMNRLIEMEMITKWQSEKLLSQKYKGFFLGKYKILGHIGTGGMSSVYLVEHVQMHQRRAIKVLPRKRVSDKTYLERFYIEARASASLNHPNIVRAFDVDHDEETETHYLIMEFVDGRDVGKIIEEDGKINPRDAASYIAQAANALQFAHDEGVIHRDVKPGNLLVDKNNEVKILDLGLALFKEDEYSLTLEYNEKILGTADYLAPEQAMNSHTVDHRADIYGLGCTLFFMLAGEPPFNEGTLAQRISMHQTRSPKKISEYRNDCPDALQKILDRMMEKDPDDRPQSCNEVNQVLSDWLAGRTPAVVVKQASLNAAKNDTATPIVDSSGVVDASLVDRDKKPMPASPSETVAVSDDDSVKKASSSSGSHSKIRLNAVSFSDIVAGSEIHSQSSQSLTDVPVSGLPVNRSQPNNPESTSRKTIEITPVVLMIMILVSVFASSAFTILVLDWLSLLGG